MAEWIDVCSTEDIVPAGMMRFDHGDGTFAIYRSSNDGFYCTEGMCTHEKIHLADGLMIGSTVECPKHNGTFNFTSGEALSAPVCVNLKTYPTKVEDDRVSILI